MARILIDYADGHHSWRMAEPEHGPGTWGFAVIPRWLFLLLRLQSRLNRFTERRLIEYDNAALAAYERAKRT